MTNLLKKGNVMLIMAIIGLITIWLGLAWLGLIIYIISFICSIIALHNEFKELNVGFVKFVLLKLNDVFSKDILSKGSHMIVILLLPIVVYFFYADLVVDSVNDYYNELEDSINSWLD